MSESSIWGKCATHGVPLELVGGERGKTFVECPECRKEAKERLAAAFSPRPSTPTDTERLDWWFAHGLTDSVCEGSVDLWRADEQDGDAVECVTHGTTVRDALDKAMRGIYDS